MMQVIDLQSAIGFDWDTGNRVKNEKHGVTVAEVEEVFFNQPIVLIDDLAHSSNAESRYHAFGTTDEHRLLHVIFALRETGQLIRPISARSMSRKERLAFAQTTQASS